MGVIRLLSLVALVGSVAWAFAEPGFEPYLAVVAAITAVVSTFIIDSQNSKRLRQSQTVSEASTGLQAGGDVNVGNVWVDKDAQ